MSFFYTMLALMATLAVAPLILWKAMFSDRRYLSFLGIYRGASTTPGSGKSIWIHASSVGEVRAALVLLEKINQREPRARIVLTLFTPRGMKAAARELSSDIEAYYLPLDVPPIIRRAYRMFNPGILIILETELWPNLIREALSRRLPTAIVNGRLSHTGFRRYFSLKTLFGPILSRIDYIHSQSKQDAGRYLKLGADKRSVHRGSNIKLDGMLSNLAKYDRRSVMDALGLSNDVKLIVCGSTRDGEEETIIDAFREARLRHPDLRLLLAPRHTVRVDDVVSIVQKHDYAHLKRSRMVDGNVSDWDVLVLDTMGELWKMYGLGICAFVGGSLVPVGGHNPLEPIALGVPTCFGPHMDNALELAENCVRHGLATVVHDSKDLAKFILRCVDGEIVRPEVGEITSLFASDIDTIADNVVSLWKREDA